MNKLQRALSYNATFSGITGFGLIIFHKHVANIFAASQSTVFWIIGIVLIYFASTIILEIFKQRSLAVLLIVTQDFVWVIGSVILLVLQPFNISSTGNSAIAIVALIVLFMAIKQYLALSQIDSTGVKGRKQLTFKRTVNASKSTVWKVISDVENYHQVAPNIDDTTIVSGKDQGMIRKCSHGKDSWTETCSIWEEEKEYAFEINTSAPDYPYPFKYLNGNWKIEEIDSTQTKVIMIFELEYKKRFQNWLLHPILKTKFSKTAEELLDNWQQQIEKK